MILTNKWFSLQQFSFFNYTLSRNQTFTVILVINMFRTFSLYLQTHTKPPVKAIKAPQLLPGGGGGSTEVKLCAPYTRLSRDLQQQNQRPLASYRPVYHAAVLRMTPTPSCSQLSSAQLSSLSAIATGSRCHPSINPTTHPQAALRLTQYEPFFRGSC